MGTCRVTFTLNSYKLLLKRRAALFGWKVKKEKGAAFKIELGGVLKDENPTPPRNSFSREDFPNSPLEKGQ
ncbi:MAG: hypothetical protein A2W17_00325 [Planctomycetes bacterium RBG_16_41_13]|nr:MAG: hypothetical protein A2W17_00325 [Planctomycetes bacterium RBG_16_41_13]